MKSKTLRINYLLFLLLPLSCGTASTEDGGRCKPASSSGYVAADMDSDGTKWKILVPSSISVTCSADADEFTTGIYATIKDGREDSKSGLIINVVGSGLTVDHKTSDPNTDSCGMAVINVKGKCPASGKDLDYFAQVFSGPLFSDSISISVSKP